MNDFDDYPEDDDEPRTTECKRCGKAGLHWEDIDDRWVLYERGEKHRCDPKRVAKIATTDFENLT